jgi:RNA polymerase sigma factor (TIGR02999 family)
MTNRTITQLLHAAAEGSTGAFDELVHRVYGDLERMAQAHLRRERPGHSLQPSELVSEAYMRLAEVDRTFQNRSHFFGAAAIAMRRVLVDHARRRAAAKRGGQVRQVTFEDMAIESEEPSVDLLALDQALDALAQEDERLGKLVHLRYFLGLSIPETADMLGVSPATVKRDWTYARAWLLERMRSDE